MTIFRNQWTSRDWRAYSQSGYLSSVLIDMAQILVCVAPNERKPGS